MRKFQLWIKFKKLVKSIKDFPEMATARPIIVNKDMVILGGNMRYKAMIENAVDNLNNNEFWKEQLEQDLWIHKQIEKL